MLGEQVSGAVCLALDFAQEAAQRKRLGSASAAWCVPQYLVGVVEIPERPVLQRHLIADDGAHRDFDALKLAECDATQLAVQFVTGDDVVKLHAGLEHPPSRCGVHQRKCVAAQAEVADTNKNVTLIKNSDLGEWNDIHPLNKEDVGKRLALAAGKIAYYENFAPYSFKENNITKGIFIDISNLVLGKMMGYEVIQESFPWERAQDLVKKGIFDSHHTTRTKERDVFLDFQTEATIYSKVALVYSKNNPKKKEIDKINSKEKLKNYDLLGYLGDGWSKEQFKNDNYLNFRIIKKSQFFVSMAMFSSSSSSDSISINTSSSLPSANHFFKIFLPF